MPLRGSGRCKITGRLPAAKCSLRLFGRCRDSGTAAPSLRSEPGSVGCNGYCCSAGQGPCLPPVVRPTVALRSVTSPLCVAATCHRAAKAAQTLRNGLYARHQGSGSHQAGRGRPQQGRLASRRGRYSARSHRGAWSGTQERRRRDYAPFSWLRRPQTAKDHPSRDSAHCLTAAAVVRPAAGQDEHLPQRLQDGVTERHQAPSAALLAVSQAGV
jgi:hypothetical protein